MLTAPSIEPYHASYIEFDSYDEIDAFYEKEIEALEFSGWNGGISGTSGLWP